MTLTPGVGRRQPPRTREAGCDRSHLHREMPARRVLCTGQGQASPQTPIRLCAGCSRVSSMLERQRASSGITCAASHLRNRVRLVAVLFSGSWSLALSMPSIRYSLPGVGRAILSCRKRVLAHFAYTISEKGNSGRSERKRRIGCQSLLQDTAEHLPSCTGSWPRPIPNTPSSSSPLSQTQSGSGCPAGSGSS